jgi:hypothetical protein
MKVPAYISVSFFLSLFLQGSGCTKIELPVHENSSGEELRIVIEKEEILDTEPLRIQAHGGDGNISWSTEPVYENCFQPEKGVLVLFTPPDISHDTVITLIASDEKNVTAQSDITVIDEGDPPEPGAIFINEIAWAGTLSGAYDEYIELINKGERAFYLNNWGIVNAAGKGNPLLFSGRIEPEAPFLITNYSDGDERTAVICTIDCSEPSLAIPNDQAGPFILKNIEGTVFDTVGDGGDYLYGINTSEVKSSMSRYTYSYSTEWNPKDWYTESMSINLIDNTFGTPGSANSDIPFGSGSNSDDAAAMITEYFIDANEGLTEDWVELYITKGGNIKNFMVTDLDGESDASITNGIDFWVSEGEYVLVVWSTLYQQEGNTFYIPDNNPTGTKDELVLLSSGTFLDGLCYYSTDTVQFDDKDEMMEYGWTGDPIFGKHAAKKITENGSYITVMEAAAWDGDAEPTPGKINK